MVGWKMSLNMKVKDVLLVNGVVVLLPYEKSRFKYKISFGARAEGINIFIPKNTPYDGEFALMPATDYLKAFDGYGFQKMKRHLDDIEEMVEKFTSRFSKDNVVDAITMPTKRSSINVIVKSVYYALLTHDILTGLYSTTIDLNGGTPRLKNDRLREKLKARQRSPRRYDYETILRIKYAPFRYSVYALDFIDKDIFSGEIVWDNGVSIDLWSKKFPKGKNFWVFKRPKDVREFIEEYGNLAVNVLTMLYRDRRKWWENKKRTVEGMVRLLVKSGLKPPVFHDGVITGRPSLSLVVSRTPAGS